MKRKPDLERLSDPELQDSLRELADAFERAAPAEEQVTARLEARVRAGNRRRVLGTMALAAAVVAAIAIGVRAINQQPVGSPMPMPDLVGVFVTAQPDQQGRCYAVRLYDTTPQDRRVALWTWTGASGCSGRSDNLSSGLGQAQGVKLPDGAGVLVDAAPTTPVPLAGVELVLDAGSDGKGLVVAYPSVDAAASGVQGQPMEQVQELDVTYRPN